MVRNRGSDADPVEGVWEATSCCAVPLHPGGRHPGVSSNHCRRWVVVRDKLVYVSSLEQAALVHFMGRGWEEDEGMSDDGESAREFHRKH